MRIRGDEKDIQKIKMEGKKVKNKVRKRTLALGKMIICLSSCRGVVHIVEAKELLEAGSKTAAQRNETQRRLEERTATKERSKRRENK